MTVDEHLVEIERLEAALRNPAQVRDASGRFVAYAPQGEVIKALAYHRGEVLRLSAAAAVAAGTGGRRQIRIVYAGRGY